jgi:hypothetical protein
MDVETLSKVGEIVKNINVGFDGNLNSETLVDMTELITQYLWMVQVKSICVNVLWAVAVVISSFLVGKAIMKFSVEA